MTTVGRARRVFNRVMVIRFPAQRLNAMENPSGTPASPAMTVEITLTLTETQTMVSISGSSEKISLIAARKLSSKRVMGLLDSRRLLFHRYCIWKEKLPSQQVIAADKTLSLF